MCARRVQVDPFSELPVLILEDASGLISIGVDVGTSEAQAIASELANVELERPVSHDLIKTILGECGARVEWVELREVRRDTVYAAIVLGLAPGTRVAIDARPSDAIAVALRTGARILVARKVIDKARRARGPGGDHHLVLLPGDGDAAAGEGPPPGLDGAWILEALADEDFGKWKM
jgi:bifunctional DNase/RNase